MKFCVGCQTWQNKINGTLWPSSSTEERNGRPSVPGLTNRGMEHCIDDFSGSFYLLYRFYNKRINNPCNLQEKITPFCHILFHCFSSSWDFLVGIVALPLWIARSLLKVADEEDPLSFAVRCFYFFFVGISTYNLCTLSLERYVGVILPLRYNEIVTVRRFQYAVASVWVLSGITACLCLAIHEDTYWFVAVCAVFFMPGIVISYCYVCIFKETYRHPRANEQLQAASGSTNQTHNRKASLTIAVVIGVFYMTTLPALAFSIHEVVSGKNAPCQTKKTLESWGTWALFFAYSNAAINPWIYAVRKREFRDALKILMFWKH